MNYRVSSNSSEQEKMYEIISSFNVHTPCIIQIVPKKIQSAFGYRLRKNPLWHLKNQTRLWNSDYFSTIQWRPHLIWPSSNKEIWIFVKQVICSFLPSFVTWMYVASTGRFCSQRQACKYIQILCIPFFKKKVVPDNLKACQICKSCK